MNIFLHSSLITFESNYCSYYTIIPEFSTTINRLEKEGSKIAPIKGTSYPQLQFTPVKVWKTMCQLGIVFIYNGTISSKSKCQD